jgi:hypothetical protein
VTPGTRQDRRDRRATASVKLHGPCTGEDGLDRTRPSPGSAGNPLRAAEERDRNMIRQLRLQPPATQGQFKITIRDQCCAR